MAIFGKYVRNEGGMYFGKERGETSRNSFLRLSFSKCSSVFQQCPLGRFWQKQIGGVGTKYAPCEQWVGHGPGATRFIRQLLNTAARKP